MDQRITDSNGAPRAHGSVSACTSLELYTAIDEVDDNDMKPRAREGDQLGSSRAQAMAETTQGEDFVQVNLKHANPNGSTHALLEEKDRAGNTATNQMLEGTCTQVTGNKDNGQVVVTGNHQQANRRRTDPSQTFISLTVTPHHCMIILCR
jgi:hypothetical protein